MTTGARTHRSLSPSLERNTNAHLPLDRDAPFAIAFLVTGGVVAYMAGVGYHELQDTGSDTITSQFKEITFKGMKLISRPIAHPTHSPSPLPSPTLTFILSLSLSLTPNLSLSVALTLATSSMTSIFKA